MTNLGSTDSRGRTWVREIIDELRAPTHLIVVLAGVGGVDSSTRGLRVVG
jgi:hypothetical protein